MFDWREVYGEMRRKQENKREFKQERWARDI